MSAHSTILKGPVPVFALLFIVSACGPSMEGDVDQLVGNCTLPARIGEPSGQLVSLEQMIDKVPGEYRATKVEFFVDATSYWDERRYMALTESNVLWSENGEPADQSFVVACQDGYDDTTANISVPIPYSVNRSNGALAQSKTEKIVLKGAQLVSHTSDKFEGKTMENFVYDLHGDFFSRPVLKIYKQTNTKFLFLIKASTSLAGKYVLHTAVTYELR
jgi:hypothetical protein